VGHVEAIHITSGAGAPMQGQHAIEAVPGRGLAGDRYLTAMGFYSARPTDPGAREVTLFEAEVLDWLAEARGITFDPAEHRRNLTVRGVRLEALIGKRFRVGAVVLEGVRDCPPCEHLEQVTGKRVLAPLVGRGGLRARVVVGGTIRVGDPLTAEEATAAVPAEHATQRR
jgi:MOSC domain-containing protein YiiM